MGVHPLPKGEGQREAQGEGGAYLAAILDAGPVRGRLERGARLADFIWFRTGGPAECLFRPSTPGDLTDFLRALPPSVPVMPIGVGSNLIARDGGVPGVVVRLPKAFADVRVEGHTLHAGAAAMGITVASAARDAGVAGLEFLRGIPGTLGGAVRMNAGAYGREMADVLVEATVVLRDGAVVRLSAGEMGYSYRHSALPEGAIVIAATLRGRSGDPGVIGAEMDRIAAEREASQPLRSRTGGSTFKNPAGRKAWELIDAAGCRGLRLGGAQVSEKHCNFLLNTGEATSADIEGLGEDVRARVLAHSGVSLEWEIERVGVFGLPSPRSAALRIPLPPGEGEGSPSPGGRGTGGEAAREREGPNLVPARVTALEHAKRLRASMTPAERKLWSQVRAGRIAGAKFKRQVPIGPFVVDFVSIPHRLIVEVDGSQHADASDYDARRTAYLEAQGFRVLRFWNGTVLGDMAAVMEGIYAALAAPPSPRSPSARIPLPLGEGEANPLPKGEGQVRSAREREGHP